MVARRRRSEILESRRQQDEQACQVVDAMIMLTK